MIILLLVFTKFATTGTIPTSQNCHNEISIQDCTSDIDNVPTLSKTKTNQFIARFESDCSHGEIFYNWLIETETTLPFPDQKSNVLNVAPFVLGTGPVIVRVNLTHEGERLVNLTSDRDSATCLFEVEPELPIPVITGGSERVVESLKDFTLDASQSIDRDVPRHQKGDLTYTWSCEVIQGDKSDFCTKTYNDVILTVPKEHAIKNNKYKFTLKVRTSDSEWQTSSQVITILDNSIGLEIVCEKNCPPASSKTDASRLTFLRAKCTSNCERITKTSFEWTVESTEFDYKNTQFGRNEEKFIIDAKALQPGRQYKITLSLTGGLVGSAVKIIQAKQPVQISSCQVNPQKGLATKTKFSTDCKYIGNATLFEILTKNDGREVPVIKGKSLEDLKFTLPAQPEVFIKIVDEDGIGASFKLDVVVESVNQEISEILAETEELIKNKRYHDATGVMSNLAREMKNKSPASQEEIKREVLKFLQKFPPESQDEVKRIVDVVLNVGKLGKTNPDLAEIATNICKTAATVNFQEMKKEFFPKDFAEESKDATGSLMSCGEKDAGPEILTPTKPPVINLTTPFPILTDVPVIDEDYPDYSEDSDVPDSKIDVYEGIAQNYVNICTNALETISLSMVDGEKPIVSSSEYSEVLVKRDIGKNLVNESIEAKNFSITLPSDFNDVSETVEVMACSWARNPFWWSTSEPKPITNVVFVKLREDGSTIDSFQEPLTIVLKINLEKTVEVHKFGFVSVPYEKHFMSVVRVTARRKQPFLVEFLNVDDTFSFYVLITNFYKPTADEIRRKGRLVTKTENIFREKEDENFNTWYYISVIPQNSKLNLSNVTYKISVYSTSCYSWSDVEKKWIFACKAKLASVGKIACSCNHLSILSAMCVNNPVRLEDNPLIPSFTLTLNQSPIVFISLSVTFGIYCVLLLFVPFVHTGGKNLYLMADLSKSARYLYILLVKTGSKMSAGTTSNICVKIYGNEGASANHVLNYPDPHDRILKRGNRDWFVLSTKRHLGDLLKMEIWTNCSGRDMSWYCEEILVCDPQIKKEWLFKINCWIGLPPKAQVEVAIETSRKKENSKSCLGIICNLGRRNFSFLTRITLVFSVIVTIYFYDLVLFGLPQLRLSDSFEKYHFVHPHIFVVSFSGAFIALPIHVVAIYFFKKKNFKFRIICWSFLIFNIVFCMMMLIIFGFWIPSITGWLWFMSNVLATCVYFLLENVSERLLQLTLKIQDEDFVWKYFSEIVDTTEKQRLYLHKTFGASILRPEMENFYQKLEHEEIKEKILHEQRRNVLWTLLEDITMFTIYVLLLYLSIYANKDALAVTNRKELENLISGSHVRADGIDEANIPQDIYTYINQTLIPSMQSLHWYSKYVVNDPGMMIDFHNKYLGVVRLRQKRISNITQCTVPSIIKFFLNLSCTPEYWNGKIDLNRFGPAPSKERLSSVWDYTKAEKSGYSVYLGELGNYYGGGHIATLGRTMYNSYFNLNYLEKNVWLDLLTRALFIEFLVYNVNTNLFTSITIIAERSATGFMTTATSLETTRLLFLQSQDEKVITVIFSSFVVVVIAFTVKWVVRIVQLRKMILSDLWVLVDLLIVGLSYTCFALFIYRMKLVKKFLEAERKAKKNEFVNYLELFHEELTFTLVAAFLVFVSMLRLWKLVRFATVFKIMEKTLLLTANPLLSLFLCHVTILLAFSISGYIFFGNQSDHFRNMPETFVTLMLLSLGLFEDFNFESITSQSPKTGRTYYVAYMIFCQIIYTIYVAVICISYSEAKVIHSSESDFQEIKDFVSTEFSFGKKWIKTKWIRLRGGAGKMQRKYVLPKADEHRYANSLLLPNNKLKAMTSIALCRNIKSEHFDKKLRLMTRIVKNLFREDSENNEIFYAVSMENNKKRLMHDNKLLEMEEVLNAVLTDSKIRGHGKIVKNRTVVKDQRTKLDYILEAMEILNETFPHVKLK